MSKTLVEIKKDNGWNPKKPKSDMLREMISAYCANVDKYFTDYVLCEIPEDIPVWVAGGALRDYFLYGYVKSGTDIDLFTDNKIHFNMIKESLLEFYDLKYESELALSFFDKEDNEKMVQLIKIFNDNPNECIGRFDFTVCCAYVGRWPIKSEETKKELQVVSDAADEFYEDCFHKKLRLIRLNKTPTITIQRIKNYIAKGFEISEVERLALVNNYLNEEFQLEELIDEYEGLRLA